MSRNIERVKIAALKTAPAECLLAAHVINLNQRANPLRSHFLPDLYTRLNQPGRDALLAKIRAHSQQIDFPAPYPLCRESQKAIHQSGGDAVGVGNECLVIRLRDHLSDVCFRCAVVRPDSIFDLFNCLTIVRCGKVNLDHPAFFFRSVQLSLRPQHYIMRGFAILSSGAESTAKAPPRVYLYLTVFVGGMTTLALELSASRLLGNVFGTSNLVWANVIGLILLYLTVGYFLGGRWADRSPYYTTFYTIIVWSAFLGALIPLAARPVLRGAAQAVIGAEAGLAIGSFLAVLVLFAVPITLLGCVSPFAIRLAMQSAGSVADAGKVSGRIYAVSTLGSLVGTFLPTLFLIPELGTFATFILFAGILYLVGFLGLLRHQRRAALRLLWMPAAIALLAFLVLNGPLRPPAEGTRLLYEDESAYNYIQVHEDASGYRYLYLNEGQGVHSQWHPTEYGDANRTWSFFLTAPYFNPPPYLPDRVESLLIIGLAAGTIARQYTHVYGSIPIDGIEIDPGIIEAGQRFFEMNMPNLTVYAQDGRYVLNQLNTIYSVIAVDAYRPPYIPWHLTTVEFFKELRAHLRDDGVVAINVGRTNTDRRLVDALTATLLRVFPSVHAMDVPRSFNTILVATMQPTEADNLARNLDALPADADPLLRDALTVGESNRVSAAASELVFTDDRAPVETLVDSLVLNFLLSGGTEQLQ